MKQLILQTLIIVLAVITLNAQTPEAFKYQAVARGTNGQPLTNQAINLRISILQTSASGTTVYAETHSATTNDFGLFTLNIGEGTMETGNFSTIDWGADNYFIQVEMDETGGTSYNLMGTSQLLSVPYALYAESANTVANDQVDDADADPANEIQSLSLNTNELSISNGNTIELQGFPCLVGFQEANTTLDITGVSTEWLPTPGNLITDTLQIEVVVNSLSDVFHVFARQRFNFLSGTATFATSVKVFDSGNSEVFHGALSVAGDDDLLTKHGGSGNVIVSGLNPGTYKFRLVNYCTTTGTRSFLSNRHILVYKIQ